jgi:hypothetical protein
VASSELTIGSEASFRLIGTYGQGVEVNGVNCGSCRPIWEGFLAGDAGGELALMYTMQRSGGDRIIGAAAFVAGEGGGEPGGFTGTKPGQVSYSFLKVSLANAWGGDVTFVDGRITSFPSAFGTVEPISAEVVEGGSFEDVAWARWANGGIANASLGSDVQVGATGGYHVFSGNPTLALPASGKVDYELSATTSFTDDRGSMPGTLTGDLAIQFGTTTRVGMEMQAEVGGLGWSFATAGGVANPGSSAFIVTSSSSGFTFGGAAPNVTGTGGACSLVCLVNVSGALYGEGAAHAAVAMNVIDAGLSGNTQASGVAIFTAGAAPTNPYARLPDPAGAAPDEWARFTGAAPGLAKPDFPGAAPGATPTATLNPADAAALFGGQITFAGR